MTCAGDSRDSPMTSDEFLHTTIEQEVLAVDKDVTDAYVECITRRLSSDAEMSPEAERRIRKSLRDTLKGLATVERNAQFIDGHSSNTFYEVITNVSKEYQELLDIALLLLNAPKSPDGFQTHTFRQNQEARDKQLQKFFHSYQEKFPGYQCDRMTGIVETYQEIQEHVHSFLRCMGNRAKLALIVYNGHGTSTGCLSLNKDTGGTSNDTFVKDVHRMWAENKSEEYHHGSSSVYLPQRIKLILAQCYGHLYKQDSEHENVIQVVSLSKPSSPITTSMVWWSERNISPSTKVVDSAHTELQHYVDTRGDGRSSDYSIIDRPIQPNETPLPILQIVSQNTPEPPSEQPSSEIRNSVFVTSSIRTSMDTNFETEQISWESQPAITFVKRRVTRSTTIDDKWLRWQRWREERFGRLKKYHSLPPTVCADLAMHCSIPEQTACAENASAPGASEHAPVPDEKSNQERWCVLRREHSEPPRKCNHRYCQSRYETGNRSLALESFGVDEEERYKPKRRCSEIFCCFKMHC